MKNLKNIEYLGQKMRAKGYASSTINQYKSCMCNLSVFYDLDFSKVFQKDIQDFLIHRVVKEKRSFADENQHINAFKLFWYVIYGKKLNPRFVERPQKTRFIPNILTPQQIERVIFNTENLKHQTILFIIYHNALRISEVQNLTLMDVRTKCDNPHLIIRESKHNGTGFLYMEQRCVGLVKSYYKKYHPKQYLFEGANGNKYSKTTITNILKAALRRENISIPFRVHDLRHCAATHALLNGTDIYNVSKWLRHKSVKTTEEYYSHMRPDQLNIIRNNQSQNRIAQ